MHLHIPDGVFPVWLWLSSFVILLPLLAFALYKTRKDQKKLVTTSAVTALLMIVFSAEFFGYHLNLTVLAGIILGPYWSLVSLTANNFFLALFGHGGITVAPLNILINWFEALCGYFGFALIKHVKNARYRAPLTGVLVVVTIMLSFLIFLGVVAVSGINPGFQIEENAGTVHLSITDFAVVAIIPTIVGALIEGVLTAVVISFISKTSPKLIT